jgi:hypothetical protein
LTTTTTTTVINDITSVNSEVSSQFERKLDLVTADLPRHYRNMLLCRSIPNTCSLDIVDYLTAMKSEKNLSAHSRGGIIKTLTQLSRFVKFKEWKSITRDDNATAANKDRIRFYSLVKKLFILLLC